MLLEASSLDFSVGVLFGATKLSRLIASTSTSLSLQTPSTEDFWNECSSDEALWCWTRLWESADGSRKKNEDIESQIEEIQKKSRGLDEPVMLKTPSTEAPRRDIKVLMDPKEVGDKVS
jgi:hypothetical protein